MKINDIIVEASIKQRLKTLRRRLDPTIRSRLAQRSNSYLSNVLSDPPPGELFGHFDSKTFRNSERLDRLSRGENPWRDKKSYVAPVIPQGPPRIVIVDVKGYKQRVVVTNEGTYYSLRWRTPDGKQHYEEASIELENMDALMDFIKSEVTSEYRR